MKVNTNLFTSKRDLDVSVASKQTNNEFSGRNTVRNFKQFRNILTSSSKSNKDFKSNSFEEVIILNNVSLKEIRKELEFLIEEEEKPTIPIKKGNYILERNIGEGAFGKVKKGYHVQTYEKVAIKILDKTMMKEDEGDFIRVTKEITILKKLRHKNIVQLYEIIESERKLYLVIELCDYELFDYIVDNQKLDEAESCKYFQELIDAVEYLHIQSIVHRDLKPENLLLDVNKSLKITDFGLSTIYGDDLLTTPCGTPSYAPPEMLKGEPYHGMLSDVWSCGVILYAMVCGYLPFSESNEDLNCKNIVEGKFEIPNTLSPLLINLLNGILRINPLERYDILQIKEDPWFNSITPRCVPGMIIGLHEIPIDDSIVKEMLEEFCQGENIISIKETDLLFENQEYNDIVEKVKNNIFDNITATYYLKVKQRSMAGIASVSDLHSDLYINHITASLERHLAMLESQENQFKIDFGRSHYVKDSAGVDEFHSIHYDVVKTAKDSKFPSDKNLIDMKINIKHLIVSNDKVTKLISERDKVNNKVNESNKKDREDRSKIKVDKLDKGDKKKPAKAIINNQLELSNVKCNTRNNNYSLPGSLTSNKVNNVKSSSISKTIDKVDRRFKTLGASIDLNLGANKKLINKDKEKPLVKENKLEKKKEKKNIYPKYSPLKKKVFYIEDKIYRNESVPRGNKLIDKDKTKEKKQKDKEKEREKERIASIKTKHKNKNKLNNTKQEVDKDKKQQQVFKRTIIKKKNDETNEFKDKFDKDKISYENKTYKSSSMHNLNHDTKKHNHLNTITNIPNNPFCSINQSNNINCLNPPYSKPLKISQKAIKVIKKQKPVSLIKSKSDNNGDKKPTSVNKSSQLAASSSIFDVKYKPSYTTKNISSSVNFNATVQNNLTSKQERESSNYNKSKPRDASDYYKLINNTKGIVNNTFKVQAQANSVDKTNKSSVSALKKQINLDKDKYNTNQRLKVQNMIKVSKLPAKQLSLHSINDLSCLFPQPLEKLLAKFEEVMKIKRISYVKITPYKFKCSKSGICFNCEIFKVFDPVDTVKPINSIGSTNEKISVRGDDLDGDVGVGEGTGFKDLEEFHCHYFNFKSYSGDIISFRKVMKEVLDLFE